MHGKITIARHLQYSEGIPKHAPRWFEVPEMTLTRSPVSDDFLKISSKSFSVRLGSNVAFWSRRIKLIWIRHQSDSGAALGQTSNIIGRI